MLNLPLSQEMSEHRNLNKATIRATIIQMKTITDTEDYEHEKYIKKNTRNENSNMQLDPIKLPSSNKAYENYSSTMRFQKCNESYSDTTNRSSGPYVSLEYTFNKNSIEHTSSILSNNIFETKHAVYTSLFDNGRYNSTRSISSTGTQATASINKCLQVQSFSNNTSHKTPSILDSNSQYYSSNTMASFPYNEHKAIDRLRFSDVYFFGRKRDPPNPDKTGMGKCIPQRSGQTHTMPINIESRTAQTKRVSGASIGTCTKNVSIKESSICGEKNCPANGNSLKGDMMATVSHIKLGPREPCPVHGKEPCQGPKCILASSGEEQAPVKVSTMTNPRRGVFELVIRRITGAPLAKNELMLEWTPPPSRPVPCGQPCTITCSPPVPCRPSKCKMIVCRPSPCQPKGCRKPCGSPCRSVPCSSCCTGKPCRFPKPCRPCRLCRPCPPPRKIFKRIRPPSCCRPCKPCTPCPPSPCGRCSSCSVSPCIPSPACGGCRRCRPCPKYPCRPRRPYKPRPPSPCKPCPPTPCAHTYIICPQTLGSPCVPPPCVAYPCQSSPCLSPCPRRKKARKCKSQPKIRARRKRISPCLNRSKLCPVVRCRSVPSPCIGCSPPCPPRKCCSISPCKPLRCCKSSCSSCCP